MVELLFSAAVLLVLWIGFYLDPRQSLKISWGLCFLGLLLMAWGLPAWRLLGPCLILPAISWLLIKRKEELISREKQLRTQETEYAQKIQTLEVEAQDRAAFVSHREKLIQEIADLYQLSKQFLGSLEWDQARSLTDEALQRWVPSLQSSDRERILHRVEKLVGRGKITPEAFAETLIATERDESLKDRLHIVAGQLALGMQRIALYAQVEESATHDSLTGLWVRRYFQDRLQEEIHRSIRRSTELAFLMVDLDHFKQVNDRHGHLVGDVVLREVAARIRGSVREMDLVGRYGGEEFSVSLPDAGKDLAIAIAERIRKSVCEGAINAYDEQVEVTVSIGVSLCPAQATTLSALIEKADAALYRAKGQGRNKVVIG